MSSEEGGQRKILYQPSQEKPMHVIVFGSGSGTNLEAILRAQRNTHPPLYEVKALFTDRFCRFHEIAERERIPLIYNSFQDFFKARSVENKKDFKTRVEYDTHNVQLIENCAREHNFVVDLIFLAGYMRMLYPPMITHFRDKIINVHPADLTKRDAQGNRLYVGPNTVHDALKNGETRTRSSIILVDENMDTGPILVSSPWIPYTEGYPLTYKRMVYHQDKQKAQGDWPASIKALELIAKGKISLDTNRTVYVNSVPQPEEGYVLEQITTPM